MSVKFNRVVGVVLVTIISFWACRKGKTDAIQNETDKRLYQCTNNAFVYLDGREPKRAVFYLDSCFAAENKVTPYGTYLRYDFLERYYYTQNKFDISFKYTDSLISVLNTTNLKNRYPDYFVNTLFEKGYLQYLRGDYESASELYHQGLLLAENIKDTCILGRYHYNMAMVLYKRKKYNESADHFKEAISDVRACPNNRRYFYFMQELLGNTGLCYTKLSMPDSAMHYYDKALRYIEKYPDSLGIMNFIVAAKGVIYGNMGDIYVKRGKKDTAILLYEKSILMNSRPGFENLDAVLTKEKLAGILMDKQEYSRIYPLLKEVRNFLDTVPDKQAELDLRRLFYQYYDIIKKPTDAYVYYKSYTALRDSIDELGRKDSQTDLMQHMSDQEQKYKITLLRKDNDLNKSYFWVALGFCFGALIIIVLIFTGYRISTRQKKALEASNSEKDKILHVVAHDLRGPVGGVDYLVGMLLEEDAGIEQKEALKLIKSASTQSLDLIEELLGLQGNDAGDMVKEMTDFCAIIRENVQLISYKANEKNQILKTELPDEPVIVPVNKDKISRVVINLVTNAIKFSGEGTVITTSLSVNSKGIVFCVKDQGIGIPTDLLPHIFELFTPAKRSGTAGEKSHGLGLSISRSIVRAHGGEMWVESEVGKGAAFYVLLP